MNRTPTVVLIVVFVLTGGSLGFCQVTKDSATTTIQPAQSVVFESSPVQFSGSTRLFGQSSDRQGTDQGLPASFVRWDLNSIFTVYGIPISINALATSEQQSTNQQLNYFSIGLNQQDLQDQIRQKIAEKIQRLQMLAAEKEQQGLSALTDSLRQHSPGQLQELGQVDNLDKLREIQNMKPSDLQKRMDELQEMGITSAISGVASLFPTLAIGTTFPNYTPLTLAGLPVTGVNVEFTPGIFYSALTTGRVLESTQGSGSLSALYTRTSYDRTLTAARVGVGRKDDTHLYITFLHGRDDAGSLFKDSTNQQPDPKENYVMGAEGKVLFFDDRLSLGGEGAMSLLTGDVGSPGPVSTPIPSLMSHLFKTNESSSYDYAFAFQGGYDFTESGTKLSALFRRIGPGYVSLGVPYLRKDLLQYEGKAEQKLFNRQASIAAYYRHDEDNLIPWKSATTVVNALGAQVSLNFRNLPYLRLNYAPLSQQTQAVADSLKIQNDITILSALTGYTFRTAGGLTSSTNFSFVFQEGKTQSGVGAYNTRSFMLMETVGLDIPLTFTVSAGLTETRIDTVNTRLVSLDCSASYTAYEVWQNSIGVSLNRDAVQRTSVYLNSSLPLGPVATLTVGVERTIFEDPGATETNYKEVLFRVTLSRSW